MVIEVPRHGEVGSVAIGLTRAEARECIATLQSLLAEGDNGRREHSHAYSADYAHDIAFWIDGDAAPASEGE